MIYFITPMVQYIDFMVQGMCHYKLYVIDLTTLVF